MTLAQQVLVWIGKIASRSDVKIEESRIRFGEKLSKWQDILPAEMLSFYNSVNGLSFLFSCGDQTWNGFTLLGLDSDGKRTYHPATNYYKMPYAKASSFSYFLHEESELTIDKNDEVLFFIGDDAAWGAIMVRSKTGIAFYDWDNDGFVNRFDGEFSDILEQGIRRHFGTNWIDERLHPENQRLIDLLSQESEPLKTYALTVNELEELNGSAYRKFFGRRSGLYVVNLLRRALGLADFEPETSDEELGEWVDLAFSNPASFSADQVKAVMKAVDGNKTKKAMVAFFRMGTDLPPVTRLKLTLRKEYETLSGYSTELLLRVLGNLENSTFCHDFPLHPDMLSYTNYRRFCFYRPFIYCRDNQFEGAYKERDEQEIIFDLVVTSERTTGLEAGKVYDSFVLSEYHEDYYPKLNIQRGF